MPGAHPPELRQRAVELARMHEKPVAQIAEDLGISDSCLRGWMRQAGVQGFYRRRGPATGPQRPPMISSAAGSIPPARTGSGRWP